MVLMTRIIVMQAIPCPVCGKQKHDVNSLCKLFALRKLERANTHLSCPKCHQRRTIGVNDDDLFECRSCHVRYCRAGMADTQTPEKTRIYNPKIRDYLPVLVMSKKGSGVFPLDESIATLRAQLSRFI